MGKKTYVAVLHTARTLGYRLKVNTVVSRFNKDENLSETINEIRPERWKIFQALPIRGQNDRAFEEIRVSEEEFRGFVSRHDPVPGVGIVPEDNAAMTGSYLMVAPGGRLFDNVEGTLRYSRPIGRVGLASALSEVRINASVFRKRGGLYPWAAPATRRLSMAAQIGGGR